MRCENRWSFRPHPVLQTVGLLVFLTIVSDVAAQTRTNQRAATCWNRGGMITGPYSSHQFRYWCEHDETFQLDGMGGEVTEFGSEEEPDEEEVLSEEYAGYFKGFPNTVHVNWQKGACTAWHQSATCNSAFMFAAFSMASQSRRQTLILDLLRSPNVKLNEQGNAFLVHDCNGRLASRLPLNQAETLWVRRITTTMDHLSPQ